MAVVLEFIAMNRGVIKGIRLAAVLIVVGAVAGGLWWWGGQEWVWWHTKSQLRRDFYKVWKLWQKPSEEQLRQCQALVMADKKAGWVKQEDIDKPPLLGYQLRFVNGQEYVIEAVCRDRQETLIEIETGRLGATVVKDRGSGWRAVLGSENETTGLVIVTDQRRFVELGMARGEWAERKLDPMGVEAVDFGKASPKNTCLGWGYECCELATEAGQGTVLASTLDCQGHCFEACQKRPYLVFFNTQPILATGERMVEVWGEPAEVVFSYELVAEKGIKVLIDWGDGTFYESSQLKEIVNHEYTCQVLAGCEYQVTLAAEDETGLAMATSRLAKMLVRVRGN